MDEAYGQIIARLLAMEGATPTGTAADLEQIGENYVGYRNAYQQLNAEVGNLRSERDGYRGAYSQLEAEVGGLRSERDGYRDAYAQLNAEVGNLRAERDGYRDAYSQIASEIGRLRAERDGYGDAYLKLAIEVGGLRAERDGYQRSYGVRDEEVGQLRALRTGLQTAYVSLAEEVRSSYAPPKQATELLPDIDQYFLIVGNGRTGSTWLLSNIDQFPDVRAWNQIGWRSPGQVTDPLYLPFEVDRSTASIKTAITRACRVNIHTDFTIDTQEATRQRSQDRIAGSKLIFLPWCFTSAEIFADLREMIDLDVKLILLKRTYVDCFLSWTVRGVHHAVDEARARELGLQPSEYMGLLMLKAADPVHIQLCNGSRALSEIVSGALLYPLRTAIDDMLVHFSNDIQNLALIRERDGLAIDYRDVGTRLGDVARHIGSTASDIELAEIAAKPLMKKLPALDRFVTPIEPLVVISDLLDQAFWNAAAGNIDPRDVWRWKPDRSALINVPGFKAALDRYGIEVPSPTNDGIEWTPGKPVLLL